MILYQKQNLNKGLTINDITGKPVLALAVSSLSIKALKDYLIETINRQITGVSIGDILMVLTVPAIWNDIAKQFMRKSAEQVMKQVKEDGFNLSDFKIHQMTTKILSQVINEAAAEVLDAVDQCIRSHSREKVLY